MEKIEIRASEVELQSDGMKVSGYVNLTNQLSEPLGSVKKFREKIAKGAFQRAIDNAKRDIDFLLGHDSKAILASTRNNSLTLREDSEGLFMSANIEPTTFGEDTFKLIKSGILKNCSFGFRSLKDSWSQVNGEVIRTVSEMELVEVSVVRDPAYSQSTIAARGIDLVTDLEVPSMEQMQVNKTEISNKRESNKMMKMNGTYNDFEQILRGEVRALQTTADGGAVIPEQVHDEIIKKMEETSPVFALARKLNSVAGTLRVTREDDSVQGGFVGEGENILEQAIAFKHVDLKQKRVGAAVTLSNQLINDSAVDIGEYTKDLLARRVAKSVEKSMLVGNGGVEFAGLVNDEEIANVETTEALNMDKLQDLYLAIHPSFLTNSAFIMQRDFFNEVAKLKDNNAHYFLQMGVVNGKIQHTLFGMPVHITDALTDENPVVFGNILEAYSVMIKTEAGIQEIVDSQQALRGSKLFVFDAYMDGVVVNPQAVAKLTVNAD
ncbi:phage major capsid protein [Sporolactobacillus terrae]|uniref:phage major capsid protein n=1 Tax=Sporolactobacillus terrae TaxID=269673 RepID=UPI001CBDE154|nr:phage major capsid protein [Sporolactobacillus terrae]UAK16119.1 phage major capsid protein [Sporolactobacillus terrae]